MRIYKYLVLCGTAMLLISYSSPQSSDQSNDVSPEVRLLSRTEIKLRRTMRDRICREILEALEKEKDIQLAYPTQRQLTETRIVNAGAGQ